MKYAQLGSVSHGTMIEEDLFEAFIDALSQLNKREAQKIQKEWDSFSHPKVCENCRDQRDYILNETLFNTLSNYAPPLAYFGAHEGDGSDFGFWVMSNDLRDLDTDEILKVNDTGDVPKSYRGLVLHVNDHGNCTLYNKGRTLKEIWAIV